MTVAFYVIGGLTAAWAVILAAIGITRPQFPSGQAATRTVMAISALLVVGSIGSGIVSGALEEDEEEEAEVGEQEAAGAETAGSGAAEGAPATEGADAGGAATRGEELELSAAPGGELAFDTEQLEAGAGPVTLVMANPSTLPHNVSLENGGVDEEGETVGEGETSTVSAELEPGDYTFYCSVPGHREGGMEGTLTVE